MVDSTYKTLTDILTPTVLYEGAFTSTSTGSVTLTMSKNNFKRIRVAYRLDGWGVTNIHYRDVKVNKSGLNDIMIDMVYGWSGTTIQIREAVLNINDKTVTWLSGRNMYRELSNGAVSAGGAAKSGAALTVVGIYGLYY